MAKLEKIKIPVWNQNLKIIQLFINEGYLPETYIDTVLGICARQAMKKYKEIEGESCDINELIKTLKKIVY